MKYCLDWEFIVRLFEAGSSIDTPFIGAVYRIHDDYKSGMGGEERETGIYELLKEFAPEYYEMSKESTCFAGGYALQKQKVCYRSMTNI